MNDKLTCPKCGCEIEITEALSSQLTAAIRRELEADVSRRKGELDQRESVLTARAKEIEQARQAVDQQVQAQLAKERKRLEEDARKKAQEAVAVDLKDKDAQIAEVQAKLKTATDNELALRKRERELAEKTESLELEVTRKLDEERDNIRATVRKQADDEHALRDSEKEQQIAAMLRQIEELKRRAEQGSQQLQGEVLELSLEGFLKEQFPSDEILPVPKGVHGSDVVQKVRDSSGSECGVILWESKRTKNWVGGWLSKLRDDQRAAKAAQAILLTEAMPEGCETFGCIEGVWVTSRACLLGVATAVRTALVEVASANRAIQGRQTKMEVLYNYLAGPEFRNRIQGIVESFVTMKEDLDGERRAMDRIWAKRQKQLERALTNTSGFYGDLQGIIGGSLAQIESLEMPALEAKPVEGEQSPPA
jgi:hypothetical protein